jgi:CheY-like chemotaxis protein
MTPRMTPHQSALAGLRVLVVEDEMLVSLLIEEMLVDHACAIVGPFATVPDAAEAATTAAIDVGILDVNVGGSKVYPVAHALAARRIPFLFLSGYGESAIPHDRPGWRLCRKPFREAALIDMLAEQVAQAQAPQGSRP